MHSYTCFCPRNPIYNRCNLISMPSCERKSNGEEYNDSIGAPTFSRNSVGKDLNNSIGRVMERSQVWMIGVLSVIVILSACFNYTNLSIARSLRRWREVGIRKVVGALRIHVLSQFVVEAVVIALFALVFSFWLFVLFKPFFFPSMTYIGKCLYWMYRLK